MSKRSDSARMMAAAHESMRGIRAMAQDVLNERAGIKSHKLLETLGIRTAGAPHSAKIVNMAEVLSKPEPQPQDIAMHGTRTKDKVFDSFGDFLIDVRAAAFTKSPTPRLIKAAAPSTSGSEGVGADGGFAVPVDFATSIMSTVSETSLLGLCSVVTTKTNGMVIPVDDAAPWEATNFKWDSELATIAQTKVSFQGRNYRLAKLNGLIPVSDELLDDAPGLDSYMRVEVPKKIAAKVNSAIVLGASPIMGILQSPALISIPRVDGIENRAKAMWQRLYCGGRSSSVFLVNGDVEVPSTPGLPLLLMGRPVLAFEACPAVGTKGDMILVDLSQFLVVMKNLRVDVSLHCFFDADAAAYRFILRMQGQGTWSTAHQRQHGDDTVSWAVALEDSQDSPPN